MIENFLRRKESCSTIHFELTPFCHQPLVTILQERGYTLDHFLAVWVLNLEEWKPRKGNAKSEKVSIQRVTDDESYEWARTVALGISSDNSTTEDSIESVRCFSQLSTTVAFLLKENGECAAGGNLAIAGQLGEMFLTSTIHSHRGKGYQNLLIGVNFIIGL
jgi:hypothetical protein